MFIRKCGGCGDEIVSYISPLIATEDDEVPICRTNLCEQCQWEKKNIGWHKDIPLDIPIRMMDFYESEIKR